MERKFESSHDPIEREVEIALRPKQFIRDCECFAFVSGLEELAAEIGNLVGIEPPRSVSLYEGFLAACHEKADEVDDSSGLFGQFVQELICGWIKARQAAGADARDTASKLLSWMEDDPYAFCYEIERNAADAFDRSGLAAFERLVRLRFETSCSGEQSDYLRRRWSAVLRAIYSGQGNVAAYVAIADRTGLTPEDCLATAEMLATSDAVYALTWVERGRAMAGEGYFVQSSAKRLRRKLFVKLGRQQEALDSAWDDFKRYPSQFAYDELMKFVPSAERNAWHNKAMDAGSGADLRSQLDLLMHTGELTRVVELVRGSSDHALEDLSHYATEPVAEKLEKTQPDIAARLWRAQGMRILNAKKSKYYDAALSNFESARDCYRRAGLPAEWEQTIRCVFTAHYRKIGFIAGFKVLASGTSCVDQPSSFVERAKARWGARYRDKAHE